MKNGFDSAAILTKIPRMKKEEGAGSSTDDYLAFIPFSEGCPFEFILSNFESLASLIQQKRLSYVLRSPFCVTLKVGGASAKKWEFR